MTTCISQVTLLFSKTRVRYICCIILLVSSAALGQSNEISQLKKLSIEDLMNIEVTSVSKSAQKLSEVASAIQVITREDIQRSGATNIPEVLRLAANLQVAQLNASAAIISARGFNTVFANKLLVLIDGRTVYTPLFGGVLWELQHVLLEDVDRIEVISGPGATLWGVNAVNGVINIITREAADTQGLYASAAHGDFLKAWGELRYGGKIGEKFYYRVFGQHQNYNNTTLPTGIENPDAWNVTQGGFRLGYYPNEKDLISVQGNIYSGTRETVPAESPFDGQNLVARWTRTITEKSDLILQVYYDRYWRNEPFSLSDELQTYDLDFQHRFPLGKNHNLLWGMGYRLVDDKVINRNIFAGLLPEARTMPVYNAFIQDEIAIAHNLKFTLGSKFLHNIFSRFEIQPSARMAWSINQRHTVWTAISRAIRAPSRFDVDYRLPLDPPPGTPNVTGTTDFDSEKLHAFEVGYRVQPSLNASFSLATFYNDYNDVYSVELLSDGFTYQIQNGSVAETGGVELSGFYQIAKWWRMRGGFTYFVKDIQAKQGRNHDPSYLANDAKHHFNIQSMVNLPANFSFDVIGRYVDYIPPSFATPGVNEYFTFDARLGWQYKQFEISVVGKNLWKENHAEFDVNQIPRNVYGRITCRF